MEKQTQIYAFYLLLILVASVVVYAKSNNVPYALHAVLVALILSYILWYAFGRKMY